MTTSRASTSASRTRAPRWANIRLTVLFPVAMLPVRPTRRKRLTSNLSRGTRERRRAASRLGPVQARADVDFERHVEGHGGFHDLAGEGFEPRHLVLGRLEEQLVVNLQEHAAPHPMLLEGPGHAHH